MELRAFLLGTEAPSGSALIGTALGLVPRSYSLHPRKCGEFTSSTLKSDNAILLFRLALFFQHIYL